MARIAATTSSIVWTSPITVVSTAAYNTRLSTIAPTVWGTLGHYGDSDRGDPLRRAVATSEPRLGSDGDRDAGARDRRCHGDLQCGPGSAAASAPLPGPRSHRAGLADRQGRPGPEQLQSGFRG